MTVVGEAGVWRRWRGRWRTGLVVVTLSFIAVGVAGCGGSDSDSAAVSETTTTTSLRTTQCNEWSAQTLTDRDAATSQLIGDEPTLGLSASDAPALRDRIDQLCASGEVGLIDTAIYLAVADGKVTTAEATTEAAPEPAPAPTTEKSAPAPAPEPEPSPAQEAVDGMLATVRSSSRPYADSIKSAKVEDRDVVIETSLYNDSDTEGMYAAVCNVFASAVSSADIDRVRVFGPGGGFAASIPSRP